MNARVLIASPSIQRKCGRQRHENTGNQIIMVFVASVDRYTTQKVDFQSFPLSAAQPPRKKRFNDRFMNSNTAITRVSFNLMQF